MTPPSPNFAALFDASPNPYLVLDRSLHIVAANRAYLESTGRELGDIVGRWAWDAYPTDPDTLKQSIASFERVIRTKAPDTMPLLRFDVARPPSEGGGFDKRYWSIVHVPVLDAQGEVELVLQHPIDVTQLEHLRDAARSAGDDDRAGLVGAHSGIFSRARSVHEANLALKAESDLLRDLFAQAPSFMALLRGPEHRFELANNAYLRLVGGRDVIGLPAREALGEVEGQGFFDLLDEVHRTGVPFVGRGVELRLSPDRGRTRSSRFVDFVYQPIRGHDGAVGGIFVEGHDVTDARTAADDLRQREERLRLVVDGAKDHAIVTTDAHGVVTSWSSGAEAIFGWTAADAVGRSISMIFTPEDRAAGADARELVTAAATGTAIDERWHLRRDGQRVFMNGSVHPLEVDADGRPKGFLKIARDETGRRRTDEALRHLTETLEQRVEERTRELLLAEEQLRHARKMEAVGQLTGGIAHDFNNLLATISLSLQLVQRKLASGRDADPTRDLDRAQASVRSAAGLTHRLLAFARRQPLDLQSVDANQLAAGMEELLRRTLGEKVALRLTLDGGACRIRSDRNQLESALLNLCINARDAMPDGGSLELTTAPLDVDAAQAREREVRPGRYLVVGVSDSGTGMSADVVDKAFDPFFTTKPAGQGTGLGLSMIYGFARQTGGWASIESAPGRGTRVSLFLPCADAEDAAAPAAEPADGEPAAPRRGATVLVVEDNAGAREAMNEVLTGLGCTVRQAGDAAAAAAAFEALPRLDLLVTDIGLPQTDGRRLATGLRRRQPGLKVLFVTGYDQTGAGGPAADERTETLLKPFTIEAFAAKVRALLESDR